jgi:hypothetical protein
MSAFTRVAVASYIAVFLAVTLLVSKAPAATTEKSLDPCVLVPRPHCPYHYSPVCAHWNFVVRGGKTVRCCAKWGCVMRVK